MAGKQKLSLDAKINTLSRIVQKGFAGVADDIARRPTNSTVAGIVENAVRPIVREETKDIRDALADIRRDLKELTGKVDNIGRLPKEIDHALERIRRIEKHLGIEADIAA